MAYASNGGDDTALVGCFQIGTASAGPDEVKPLLVMIDGRLKEIGVFGAGIILGVRSDRLYIATANHVVRKGTHQIENLRVQLKFLPGETLDELCDVV